MTTTINLADKTIAYPSSDGEPVAETYLHLYAILTTLEVLQQYLAGRQATVLANQFLYYAQGFPKLRVAPDVMVIFDVPPGGRDNYKVWEEGQVPQVVFEITSKATQKQDQEQKKLLYEQLGIFEYWLFDPKGEWVKEKLQGYRLQDEIYQPLTDGLCQPLGLRVAVEKELLRFYRLDTGDKLLIPTELAELAEQERQRAEQERQRADQERQRAEKLAEHLRSLGIDPDSLS
ncbi:Uma2 family endonuclease [Nostocales cyanobacterium LEGE 11386]|nr:Uma2 family endonuclease [Nostocales cyanobacterium LEGE 11386]